MGRFRKKPVVIEAFLWGTDAVPDWWKALKEVVINVNTQSAFIPTLEGRMEARKGDYIIQGVMGEVYPCKPDIFEATYEAVDEDSDTSQTGEHKTEAKASPTEVKEGETGV